MPPLFEGLDPLFQPGVLSDVRKQAKKRFFESRGIDPTKA